MELTAAINKCICENTFASNDLGPVLFVAAHPDDETLGAGGLLQRLKSAFFVHVTDGAPRNLYYAESAGFTSREAYAQARRHEFQEAISWAGLESFCQLQLNIIDQEASYNIAGITCRIEKIIEEIKPSCIFTHAYEGGHPDHDTSAFSVWAATKLIKKRIKNYSPLVIEYPLYHGDGDPDIIIGGFLPCNGSETLTSILTEKECNTKCTMISCFKSQQSFLSNFKIGIEQFRVSPNYDFLTKPQDSPLFYDYNDWNITSAYWRKLVSEALLLLKLA